MSLIMVQKNTERKMKIYLLTSYVIEILGNEAKILQKLIPNFWIVRIARNSRDQKNDNLDHFMLFILTMFFN